MKRLSRKVPIHSASDTKLVFNEDQIELIDQAVQAFKSDVKSLANIIQYSFDINPTFDGELDVEVNYENDGVVISCDFTEFQDYVIKGAHRMFENRIESISESLDLLSDEGTSVKMEIPEESNVIMSYTFTIR